MFLGLKASFIGMVVAVAAAAATAPSPVAQSVTEPLRAPDDRQNATTPGSGPLTHQDLLVCVELEDGVAKRGAAHNAQVPVILDALEALGPRAPRRECCWDVAGRLTKPATGRAARSPQQRR